VQNAYVTPDAFQVIFINGVDDIAWKGTDHMGFFCRALHR
jgi:hypothetical protein